MPETRRHSSGELPRLRARAAAAGRVPKARVAFWSLASVAAVLALVEPLLPLDLADRLDLSSLGIGLVFAAGLVAYFALVPLAGSVVGPARPPRAPAGGRRPHGGRPAVDGRGAGRSSVALAFAAVGAGMACMGAPSGPLMVEAVDEAGMAGRYGLSSAVMTRGLRARLRPRPAAGRRRQRRRCPSARRWPSRRCWWSLVAVWVARTLPRGACAGHGFGRRAKGSRGGHADTVAGPGGEERGIAVPLFTRLRRPTASSTRCSRRRIARGRSTGASISGLQHAAPVRLRRPQRAGGPGLPDPGHHVRPRRA